MTYDGQMWVVCDRKEIVEKLIDRTEIAIEDWLREGSHQYPQLMKKIEAYRNRKDDDTGFIDVLNTKIKMLLYNKRNVPMLTSGKKTNNVQQIK